MNHYLRLAGIGFGIFFTVTILFVTFVCMCQIFGAPDHRWPNWFVPTYFCASGAYLTSLPSVVCDILTLKRVWNNPRLRAIGVPLVGASLGLFLLGWVAVFNPLGSVGYRVEKFDGLFYPHKFSTSKSYDLISQAEMIGMCKLFMDYGMQVTVLFAALGAAGVEVYDKVKPHWTTVPFAFAYLLVLPLIFTWPQDLRDVFTRECFAGFLVCWLVLGSFAGVGVTALVWTVRQGWWLDQWVSD